MSAPIELPDEVIRDAVPEDEVVLAYVTRGALAKYVEGVAARNDAFREELEACIDGLEEAGESISSVAKAWRRPVAAIVLLAPRRRASALIWPLALAAAFILVVGAGVLRSRQQEAARIQKMSDQQIAAQNAQLEKLTADLKEQQRAMEMAQNDLANAKSDADRANAQAKLAAAQKMQANTASRINATTSGAKAGTPKAKAACMCQPGDPLCSCL